MHRNNLTEGQFKTYQLLLKDKDPKSAERYLQVLKLNRAENFAKWQPKPNFVCEYMHCKKPFHSYDNYRKYCCRECHSKAKTKSYERLSKVKKQT